MNILILGSGGREHALAWATKQNPKCDKLFVAPGNAGTAELATNVALDIEDGAAVVDWAQANDINFVIVGPEAPLAAGVADALRGAGVTTFGPSKAAAQLEASKAFTKEICDAAGAPTAGYGHFTDADAARAYLASFTGDATGETAPNALFELGAALGRLGQVDQACITLSEVSVRFPGGDLVAPAQVEMAALGCP